MRVVLACCTVLLVALPGPGTARDIDRILAKDRKDAEARVVSECTRADMERDLANRLSRKALQPSEPDDGLPASERGARMVEALRRAGEADDAAVKREASCTAAKDRYRAITARP